MSKEAAANDRNSLYMHFWPNGATERTPRHKMEMQLRPYLVYCYSV
jgi:hypothetical protein